jgi:hypothetical protein
MSIFERRIYPFIIAIGFILLLTLPALAIPAEAGDYSQGAADYSKEKIAKRLSCPDQKPELITGVFTRQDADYDHTGILALTLQGNYEIDLPKTEGAIWTYKVREGQILECQTYDPMTQIQSFVIHITGTQDNTITFIPSRPGSEIAQPLNFRYSVAVLP